jgi:1-aminocyclopropane-1-carboxylate deaminase/D-cysteine desulfhydrase-like pyridoxal-dependent ACC family enzyme
MVSELAARTAELLRLASPPPEGMVVLDEEHLGTGYGVMGEPVREAILMMARTEGVLVDPVYTGKALSGLIDLIRRGDIRRGERVLFWHTGGVPALFADRYAGDLADR